MPRRITASHLSRKEILALPPNQRKPFVGSIHITYPRLNDITQNIEAAYEDNPYADEPECRLLVGPTGAGKTTLVRAFKRKHPSHDAGNHFVCPVLLAQVHTPATINGLATVLLKVLGDPHYTRGNVHEKGARLRDLMGDCEVEMLILDEIQHFKDRDSDKILHAVSNWLKDLIKETGVACMLVGLTGDAEAVIANNDQLLGLFGAPLKLEPFEWDDERPDTSKAFRTLLEKIEERLPLREPSHLSSPDLAWRCYVASGGVMRYVMAPSAGRRSWP